MARNATKPNDCLVPESSAQQVCTPQAFAKTPTVQPAALQASAMRGVASAACLLNQLSQGDGAESAAVAAATGLAAASTASRCAASIGAPALRIPLPVACRQRAVLRSSRSLRRRCRRCCRNVARSAATRACLRRRCCCHRQQRSLQLIAASAVCRQRACARSHRSVRRLRCFCEHKLTSCRCRRRRRRRRRTTAALVPPSATPQQDLPKPCHCHA
ncbi:hypothetical protein JKP88DRAFT_220231 [Tribonema minus]|uniref:Uncharacterized protein n=1 Tax=Tribonema minus TaxID=303371 RepID=A0A835YZT9_9STRA|nr:hypothetical protein JKP88DRAFT_220231 [Tribonema minus]